MNEKELIEYIARRDYRIEKGIVESLEEAIQIMKQNGDLDLIKEAFNAGKILKKSQINEILKEVEKLDLNKNTQIKDLNGDEYMLIRKDKFKELKRFKE